MDRLTYYDDSGNPCYRMKRYDNFHMKEISTVISDSDVARKLAEYEDLEERGLLVRLPCKVGDAVYRLSHEEISRREWQWIIEEIRFAPHCLDMDFKLRINIFLTREEAERASSLKLKGE